MFHLIPHRKNTKTNISNYVKHKESGAVGVVEMNINAETCGVRFENSKLFVTFVKNNELERCK